MIDFNEQTAVAREPENEGGPVKSFLEHLEDLRWVLIKCASSLAAAMVICLIAAPHIISILKWPVHRAGLNIDLNPTGPADVMSIWMEVAIYGGLVLALPFILFFVCEFIMPALKAHERKCFLGAFIIGGGLFLCGVALCYFFLLKPTLLFMVQTSKWLGFSSIFWQAEKYINFAVTFMAGVGWSFEFPVVLLTLVRLGILPHEWLVNGRRYFFVANLTLCAIITPDVASTFILIIPVQLLLEVCVLISKRWSRQDELKSRDNGLLSVLVSAIGYLGGALACRGIARRQHASV